MASSTKSMLHNSFLGCCFLGQSICHVLILSRPFRAGDVKNLHRKQFQGFVSLIGSVCSGRTVLTVGLVTYDQESSRSQSTQT